MNSSDVDSPSAGGTDSTIVRGSHGLSTPAGWPRPHLTERELQVLQYLPTRLSVEEVAAALSISPNTVKTHLRSIYHKLGARSRNEAILIGCEQRLVSDHSRWMLPH